MGSELRRSVLTIEAAADPAAGVLPILEGIAARAVADDGSGIDAEMRHGLAYGRPATLLPYTSQDRYGRERSARELPVVVLENEVLTATFLPGYGGRLWSLIHRPSGRELLHRNAILQPANLALRDAWLAGGVEWNLGTTGHWPLTCEPLHAVRLTAADGTPVLRMFEFERMRRLVVRIDAWLPPGSPVLLVGVTVENPSEREVPVYWWTNIAVPETGKTRVVGPADRAFHFDYTADLRRVGFPHFDGADRSYPGLLPRAADYFLDIPRGERPWIAALDEDGSGLVHTSTDLLRGRKLFHWGTGAGGKRWQEWLSGPDAAYLEIQAGLARTQLEHLPMPGGATWSWVEAFGLLEADAAAVHGRWEDARAAVGEALDRLVPSRVLSRAAESVPGYCDPGSVLAHGSGWGALEVVTGAVATDLPFGETGPDQQPWRELARTGVLPVSDPPAAPIAGPEWRARLEQAPTDWHSLYHLGLMRLADGEVGGAREAWLSSLAERVTPWALRSLAFLASTPSEAAGLLLEAHRLRTDIRELTIETLRALADAGEFETALWLIENLSEDDRGHGRIRLAEAEAAAAVGDTGRLIRLLAEGIRVDNLREGEERLDVLWHAAYPGEPVPAEYDFRMKAVDEM